MENQQELQQESVEQTQAQETLTVQLDFKEPGVQEETQSEQAEPHEEESEEESEEDSDLGIPIKIKATKKSSSEKKKSEDSQVSKKKTDTSKSIEKLKKLRDKDISESSSEEEEKVTKKSTSKKRGLKDVKQNKKSPKKQKKGDDYKQLAAKSKAKSSKGVPSVASAGKKAPKKLSKADSYIKYRARLMLIDDSEFKKLDNAYISIYDASLKNRKKFEDGFFPNRWTEILRDVAAEKDVTIRGTLPHYGATIVDTDGLRAYNVRGDIVDRDRHQDYVDAKYKRVKGDRVYVGTKKVGIPEASIFAYLPSDSKPDEFWYSVRQVMEETTEDSSNDSE